MRFEDLKRHLKPYIMVANRTTTINHAFAASVAPCDSYEPARVREAIVGLDQDPNDHLRCVYCGDVAETWDHLHATVEAKEFSGFGHRIGNLVPCCKPCNSRKGNKGWREYLSSIGAPDDLRTRRAKIITDHIERHGRRDAVPKDLPEYRALLNIRDQVLALLARGDELAATIRAKTTAI
jgi:hypothetical protein